MLQNPVLLNMVLESPQIKPMLDANPQLRSIFSNPQMLQSLLNPQFLQGAMNMIGTGNLSLGLNSNLNTNLNTNSNTEPINQPTSDENTSQQTNTQNTNTNNPFGMPFLFNGQNVNNQSNVDLKEKYKEQNQKLKEMGFINDELNFQILAKVNGNVDLAVERLLNMLN
jgi:ubiquilin